MDPITHTLAGATLSRAGLGRTTPLAAAALVVAANAPDIDIFAYRGGEYEALAFRRGWTHGPLAVLVLPFAVAAGVLLWDRLVRRRRRPTSPPARAPALLLVSFVGVLSHPVLDWLNTYGVRWLMPFDRRWFYGDAVFIIDPWLWLVLGGALSLTGARSRRRLAGWLLLAALMSAPVLIAPMVPVAAKLLWIAGLLGVAALSRYGAPMRPRMPSPPHAERERSGSRGLAGTMRSSMPSPPLAGERVRVRGSMGSRIAQFALGIAAAYVVAMVVASALAERSTRAAARRGGLDPVDVMFQPAPANPFTGSVVVATDTAYHIGPFSWFDRPRVTFPRTIARGDTAAPAVVEAMRHGDVRDFLVWSRFPIVRVAADDDGVASVFIGDARYPGESLTGGGLGGVRVRVGEPSNTSAVPRRR